jgi:hypothetical protein
LSVGRYVLAFVTSWTIGLAFVQFGERVLGGWPASEAGQFVSCVLGVGIAWRLRAPIVTYFFAAMAAFSGSELAIHFYYGIHTVQGAPTHFAVIGSALLGVALGALLAKRGQRPAAFGAVTSNGVLSHNAAAGDNGAQPDNSERRSNGALQPPGARALAARG